MNRYYLFSSIIAIVMLFVSACGSVPLTGRKQLSLVSEQEVLTLSLQQYGDFKKEATMSGNKANTALVQKVGRNIANAVEAWLRTNGYESELQYYSWEFNLVKSNEVNAFCMPGGKIVVYEGILPVTRDETGLAVVLGHEVAHAVAKHANERMSQQMVASYGSAAMGMALSTQSEKTQQIGMAVFGLGAQFGVLLPYSRKQELEADHLGLVFMAMAGYDPRQAPAFWQRMEASGGGGTPEFMSTHPSDSRRIDEIKKELPEVLKYYKGAGQATTSKPANTSKKWSF